MSLLELIRQLNNMNIRVTFAAGGQDRLWVIIKPEYPDSFDLSKLNQGFVHYNHITSYLSEYIENITPKESAKRKENT